MSRGPVVLVTGATGVLGQRLVPLLRERGWTVRCLVHRRAALGVDEAVAGDVVTGRGLDEGAAGADAVVNLAAVTHARRGASYEAANAVGAQHVAEAAAHEGVRRLVHVSSRAIDPRGGGYSASKWRAERIVAGVGVPFVIVRLPEVYGAGGREGVDAMIERARRGRPIPIVGRGEHEMAPIFIDDAASALATALEAPEAAGSTYTLAGERMTMRQVADACRAAFGSRRGAVSVPTLAVASAAALGRVLPLPVYPDQLRRLRSPKPPLSPEARRDLGFEPRGLAEGLAALAAGG